MRKELYGRLMAYFLAFCLILNGCAVPAPEATLPTTAPLQTMLPTEETTVPTTLPETEPTTVPTEPVEETTAPTEPYVEYTASVGVTGDMLMHKPLITSAATGSSYDFSEMFRYISEYYTSYDYMIANLETTLGGKKAGPYQGYPHFNCPDEIVDGLMGAGVDMLLTANNHTFDTAYNGMMRTVQVLKEKGMDYLGTRESEDESFYMVKDLNGIKVGMVCYTYETDCPYEDQKALNCIILGRTASKMVNSFHYGKLDAFYTDLAQTMQRMKDDGADFTMVFLHWGDEYSLSPNANQQAMAQTLCDMGVDVIVGGHPHVIQPFETLTSQDGHTTYCIYSVGNALSNQRTETLSVRNVQYTEDGMIFGIQFEKWNDGHTQISDVHIIPTWVNRKKVNGKNVYHILPLDPALPTWAEFGVSATSDLTESYERTMGLVSQGLNAARSQLGLEEQPIIIDTSA